MRADDAMRAVAELAASQHGAFSRRQAADRNIDTRQLARRIQRGELIEPAAGVIVVAATPDTFRRKLTVATLAGNGTVASHRAAALLHGMDGFDSAPVEVTVRRGRYPEIEGVRLHRSVRFGPKDVTEIDSIRVTSVARTLCDLGAVVHDDVVEQCLDWALRRGYPESWIRQVHRYLHRPGPSGTHTLARVLADPRRTGRIPQTWFERLVQRCAVAPGFPAFELQYPLRDSQTGAIIAIFDGAFVEWRIAIEAHSEEWHDRKSRVWRDLERDNRVKALGWDIVYVTWSLAKRPAQVLETVRAIHASRRAG